MNNEIIFKHKRARSKQFPHDMTKGASIIQIDQGPYIHQILMKLSLAHSKPAALSMNSSIKLDDKSSKILSGNDHKLYWRTVWKLMFTAVIVRINIAFSINKQS